MEYLPYNSHYDDMWVYFRLSNSLHSDISSHVEEDVSDRAVTCPSVYLLYAM